MSSRQMQRMAGHTSVLSFFLLLSFFDRDLSLALALSTETQSSNSVTLQSVGDGILQRVERLGSFVEAQEQNPVSSDTAATITTSRRSVSQVQGVGRPVYDTTTSSTQTPLVLLPSKQSKEQQVMEALASLENDST